MSPADAEPERGGLAPRWLGYLAPHRGAAALFVLSLLVSTGLRVSAPQFLRSVIDGVTGHTGTGTLLVLAGAYLLTVLAAEAAGVAGEHLGARVAWSATNALRVDVLAHCLGLDLPFFERHAPGELVDRIDGDVGRLTSYFSQMFAQVAANLLLLVGIGVALIIQDVVIGLCYVPFVAGSVLLLRRLVGRSIPLMQKQQDAGAKLLGFVAERLGALEDIQANGAIEHTLRGFLAHAASLRRANLRATAVGIRWPAVALTVSSLGFVAALAAGAYLRLTGQLTVGSAFALINYAAMLQVPILIITYQFRDLEEALAASRRIAELTGQRGIFSGRATGVQARPAAAPGVQFDDVRFAYADGEPVLRGVSFRLDPGAHLAVVGRTGSGKTTLVRLLLRLVDPASGTVRLGHREIREFSLDALRGLVGFVPQDVQLFHGTVRDNVAMFDDAVPDAAISAAITEVGLGPWLSSLPDGLGTMLGVGHTGMSAAQEQLLAFARIMLTDPGLVVLDEASSRLDPASQRSIEAATGRLLAGRTAVIVAHRVETLMNADYVLVLSEGQIAEYGPLAGLIADRSSSFRRLLAAGEVLA